MQEALGCAEGVEVTPGTRLRRCGCTGRIEVAHEALEVHRSAQDVMEPQEVLERSRWSRSCGV